MEYKNYYDILGVSKDASEKEIKSAFRKAARKHHPDVNPDDAGAEERLNSLMRLIRCFLTRKSVRNMTNLEVSGSSINKQAVNRKISIGHSGLPNQEASSSGPVIEPSGSAPRILKKFLGKEADFQTSLKPCLGVLRQAREGVGDLVSGAPINHFRTRARALQPRI